MKKHMKSFLIFFVAAAMVFTLAVPAAVPVFADTDLGLVLDGDENGNEAGNSGNQQEEENTAAETGDTAIGRVQLVFTEPVIMMSLSECMASSSKEGYSVSYTKWYDGAGSKIQSYFSDDSTHKIEILVAANEGFCFNERTVVVLNNSTEGISTSLINGGREMLIYKEYVPKKWAPTVIKDPGGETVDKGGWASFVSTATYATECCWYFRSEDGNTVFKSTEASAKFPGLTTDGDNTERLNIYGIPYELNGWGVYCCFSGNGGSVNSKAATITVRGAEEYLAQQAASRQEEESGSAANEEDNAAKEQESTETVAVTQESQHVHVYPDSWRYDNDYHWRECECGETAEKSAHDYEWTVLYEATKKEDGTEQGICRVCGATQYRGISYEKKGVNISTILWIVAGVLFLAVVFVAADTVKKAKRSRAQGRHSRH